MHAVTPCLSHDNCRVRAECYHIIYGIACYVHIKQHCMGLLIFSCINTNKCKAKVSLNVRNEYAHSLALSYSIAHLENQPAPYCVFT